MPRDHFIRNANWSPRVYASALVPSAIALVCMWGLALALWVMMP